MDDDGHTPERQRRRLTVPLSAMVTDSDILKARRLLVVHRPRTAVRRVCTGCGNAWPCLDTLYAGAVTDTKPDPADPESSDPGPSDPESTGPEAQP
ncbi:hypothetical protein ACNTMW_23300 [Planosporangium sp. 12N6]|uniref:hypothetical protein n=1 Tax=Planosporangium spinosum TaxID=3402278 RepID=UPI003CE7B0C0